MSDTTDEPNESEKGSIPSSSKTPLFEAANALRYVRQEQIKQIDEEEGTTLICFVCGPKTLLDRTDLLGFSELLHKIEDGGRMDLLLHTGGGDVDACEKIAKLLHAKIGEDYKRLRVIVPDYAKSAGTLLALSAGSIIMSDTSELGMIDPQVSLCDANGNALIHSMNGVVKAYEEWESALRRNPNDPVAVRMLEQFDSKSVYKFKRTVERVRNFADDLLRRHGLPFSEISGALLDTSRWKTHQQPIRHDDARELKLNIDYIPGSDPRWRRYWKLYCNQRVAIQDDQKIFESEFVSQVS